MTLSLTIALRARLGVGACALLALAACTEGFQPFNRAASGDGPTPIGSTRLVERDVEAPEVFQITEEGLWDGRPSLGGVWVAHPTADDPERVIIRNDENGRFVIGALFRRENNSPGPALMISSDAAAALNILAGDPTLVQVTALRREELPDPVVAPASAPASDVAAGDTDQAPPTITASPLGDPIAAAAAAISAAENAQAASAPAATPQSRPTQTAATSLDRPFVQIGIFSVQENANNTAQALRNAGLVPTIYDQSANDRRFWRVVVGPAQNAADRDAILRTVRGLGFEDAYAVTR